MCSVTDASLSCRTLTPLRRTLPRRSRSCWSWACRSTRRRRPRARACSPTWARTKYSAGQRSIQCSCTASDRIFAQEYSVAELLALRSSGSPWLELHSLGSSVQVSVKRGWGIESCKSRAAACLFQLALQCLPLALPCHCHLAGLKQGLPPSSFPKYRHAACIASGCRAFMGDEKGC